MRRRVLSDHGKGESKCCRLLAVSVRFDLVKPAPSELAQKKSRVLRRDCRVKTLGSLPGNEEGGRGKRAGKARRGRVRCGGDGQRHGNLLERTDLRA